MLSFSAVFMQSIDAQGLLLRIAKKASILIDDRTFKGE